MRHPWHPDMRASEVTHLSRSLLELSASVDRLEVLEWGAGGSTIFFTDLLAGHGVRFRWESLEYNQEWFQKVSAAVAGREDVHLAFFPVGNTAQRQRHTNMDAYVAYPATLGRQFHFILVDGRKRRRCLLEARRMMAPGGRTFLHDATRKYYHCALPEFPHGRFIPGGSLWEGWE